MRYTVKKSVILVLFFIKSVCSEELSLLSTWIVPKRKDLRVPGQLLGPCAMSLVAGEKPLLYITNFNEHNLYAVPLDFDTIREKKPDWTGEIRQQPLNSPGIKKDKIRITSLELNSFPSDIAVSENSVAITQWGRNSIMVWKRSVDGNLTDGKELKTGISPEHLFFTSKSLIVLNGFDASLSVFNRDNKEIKAPGKQYASDKISIDAVAPFADTLFVAGPEIKDLSVLPTATTTLDTFIVYPPRIGTWKYSISSLQAFASSAEKRKIELHGMSGMNGTETDATYDMLTSKGGLIVAEGIKFDGLIELKYFANSSIEHQSSSGIESYPIDRASQPIFNKDRYISKICPKILSSNMGEDRYFAFFDSFDQIRIYEKNEGHVKEKFSHKADIKITHIPGKCSIDSVLFSSITKEGKIYIFVLASAKDGTAYLCIYEMNTLSAATVS